jgi:hypothetical protein
MATRFPVATDLILPRKVQIVEHVELALARRAYNAGSCGQGRIAADKLSCKIMYVCDPTHPSGGSDKQRTR